MESTPKTLEDSSCLDFSASVFEGTSQSTPVSYVPSRKRKLSCFQGARKLSQVIEAFPSPPQSCSKYHEPFMVNVEKFDLKYGQKDETDGAYTQENSRKKFLSAPNTPEKQLSGKKKENSNSFLKNFSQINVHSQSPLNKESYDILYPELPPLEPPRKPLTPQKLRENVSKNVLFKRGLSVPLSRRDLFKKVFTNHVIMGKVFKELSNGDLFRLSQVSTSLKHMILVDPVASEKYNTYVKNYRIFKENYRITPPSSPEKDENFDASPSSKHYYSFVNLAKQLNKNQSLTKCPSCNKPSVVENGIAYCQSVNSCGYIYCQKCNSFAHNPVDFKDKCNRSLLCDLSNSNTSDYFSGNSSSFLSSNSLNLNTSSKHTSGIYSESDTSLPALRARRNLSKTFSTPTESRVKILSSNNNRNVIVNSVSKPSRRRSSMVPVLPSGMETPQKATVEVYESSSPPRIKQYSACSKQSRRNLKRLTR